MSTALPLPFAFHFPANPDFLSCRSGKKPRLARARSLPVAYSSTTTPSRAAKLESIRIAARKNFAREAAPPQPGCRRDGVSLARALLLIATEDEAFVALNREKDARSFRLERNSPAAEKDADQYFFDDLETMLLAGKTITGWMSELESISALVSAESMAKDEVLAAIAGLVVKKLKTTPAESLDPTGHYLHSALAGGAGSAAMAAAVFVEVANRLGIEAAAGKTSPAWPQTWDPRADDLVRRREVLPGLDMIGIVLSRLVRLHWRRASKSGAARVGWPLRPSDRPAAVGLVRPEELGLAVTASERLLVVQPQDWAVRRDHGMLLFHAGRFGEAVQELSICMAFAPVEEAEVLEPFVEKLHLLKLESTWNNKSLTLL